MATQIEFIDKSDASAVVDGSLNSPTPGIPDGINTDDFVLLSLYSPETVGTVSVAGWGELVNHQDASGLLGLWSIPYNGEPDPTIVLVGFSPSTPVVAQIFVFRGIPAVSFLDFLGIVSSNISQIDIGPISGINVKKSSLVLSIAGKAAGWDAIGTLSDADPLDWDQIDGFSTAGSGSNIGLTIDSSIAPSQLIVSSKTFSVSGLPGVGKGVLLALLLEVDPFNVATDMVAYCAERHPEDDDGMVGGPIDPTMRAVFTNLSFVNELEIFCDEAADDGISVTVRGRTQGRIMVTESINVTGTPMPLSILGIIRTVESIIKSTPSKGNITVRLLGGGADVAVIPGNERGIRKIFASTYPNPLAEKKYYEKIFLANNHPSAGVLNGVLSQFADPTGKVKFNLASEVDDVFNTATRLTEPEITTTLAPNIFDDTDKNVPGDLMPGSAIGIWLEMTTPAADTPFRSTFSMGFAGDAILI